MKVRRYIELIKDVTGPVDYVVRILKMSGATEGEAVLALMVTREMTMDVAQREITHSKLYMKVPSIDESQGGAAFTRNIQ